MPSFPFHVSPNINNLPYLSCSFLHNQKREPGYWYFLSQIMIKNTGTPFYLCNHKSNYLSLLSSIKEQCTIFLNIYITTWSTSMFLNHCVLVLQIQLLNMMICGKIHSNPYYSKVYVLIHKTHSKEYKKTIFEDLFQVQNP